MNWTGKVLPTGRGTVSPSTFAIPAWILFGLVSAAPASGPAVSATPSSFAILAPSKLPHPAPSDAVNFTTVEKLLIFQLLALAGRNGIWHCCSRAAISVQS